MRDQKSNMKFEGPHIKNDCVAHRYKIVDYIGAGGMQYVYKARDVVLDRDVALKTPIGSSEAKQFLKSAKLSAKVNHPNVAKTLDYINENEQQYLVEELVDGNDLEKALLRRISVLDPDLVARIFHNLAKGVAASHHAHIIHRDLKPTNIIVGGSFPFGVIKITDFGIATMAEKEIVDEVEKSNLTNSNSKTVMGALPYMAPEAITSPKTVTNKVDIWALGAVIFELLTGNKPFGSGLPAVQKILNKTPPVFPDSITSKPQFKPLTLELIEIIKKCFNADPLERPDADQIVLQCSSLCYSTAPRYTGVVKQMKTARTGLIENQDDERDVFFHIESVYGSEVNVGDRVMFSQYRATPWPRAHPVVKLT